MEITKILAVPQPRNNGYYWIYGLGSDNKMYVWHEHRAEWVLHAKKRDRI